MIRGSRRYPIERFLFKVLAWLFLGSRGRLHVSGAASLPREGPLLVVGNHVATMDPPMVGSLLPRLDVHYMAKAESFEGSAGFRFLLAGWNAFPVVRHSADRRAIARALQVLAEGHVLVIFPEGTRSPDARLTRAFPGVGMLARRSGAPVVCAAIWGSEAVLPKGRLWPRSAPVNVRFSDPFGIPAEAAGRRLPSQEAADSIMRRLAAILPETYRGVYADPEDPAGRPEARPPAA